MDGVIGTWASSLFEHMSLRSEALRAIINRMMSEDTMAEDYAIKYFNLTLLSLIDSPPKVLIEHFKRKLAEGEQKYFDLLNGQFYEPTWLDPLKDAIEHFQPKSEAPPEGNDVPF
jgi:hypothetical protein